MLQDAIIRRTLHNYYLTKKDQDGRRLSWQMLAIEVSQYSDWEISLSGLSETEAKQKLKSAGLKLSRFCEGRRKNSSPSGSEETLNYVRQFLTHPEISALDIKAVQDGDFNFIAAMHMDIFLHDHQIETDLNQKVRFYNDIETEGVIAVQSWENFRGAIIEQAVSVNPSFVFRGVYIPAESNGRDGIAIMREVYSGELKLLRILAIPELSADGCILAIDDSFGAFEVSKEESANFKRIKDRLNRKKAYATSLFNRLFSNLYTIGKTIYFGETIKKGTVFDKIKKDRYLYLDNNKNIKSKIYNLDFDKCNIDDLVEAILAGKHDARGILSALNTRRDVDIISEKHGMSALHAVIARGMTESVKSLLERGDLDLWRPTRSGTLPATIALESNIRPNVTLARLIEDAMRKQSGDQPAEHLEP
ncbi:hypothetical protein [Ponticaulis koreensis]|uniref:hypothetical protein n=1 Tax=Ponticaulis koreensis TaxID=1123045 RepID=UPI0012DBCEE6|nr:hypothetical protein [Ponticaulis koreensis]